MPVAIFAGSQQRILDSSPEVGSSIRLATSTLHDQIVLLHRDPGQLRRIDRRRFEELVAEVFDGFGYTVELTSQTRDGGRDIVAGGHRDEIRIKYLIECKRPEPGNPVGVGLVRQLLGVVEDERATKGILVATTYFTPDARELQRRNEWRLELKEYEHLISWFERYLKAKGACLS